jgi:archaellum component FlaF (FlaF/FlaG flagellin family)
MSLSFILTEILSHVSMEFVVLQVCTQLVVRVFLAIDPSSAPTIDPYIPRAKRPPLYLESILTWINDGIDELIDKYVPCITVRRRPEHHTRQPPSPTRPSFSFGSRIGFDVVLSFHKYQFSKWNYSRWRERHRNTSPAWQTLRSRILARSVATESLALSAITGGIARAHSAVNEKRSTRAIFDSDSFDILVDGGATSCISNNLADFVAPPQASTVRVKGFNGTTSSTRVGTVIWNILDDTGHRRTLKIQNRYYVPACPLRILSPQHYSQQTKDLRGTYSTNFGDHVLFVWNRGKFRATMPLSPTTNVGILRSAPGHKVFAVGPCCSKMAA